MCGTLIADILACATVVIAIDVRAVDVWNCACWRTSPVINPLSEPALIPRMLSATNQCVGGMATEKSSTGRRSDPSRPPSRRVAYYQAEVRAA